MKYLIIGRTGELETITKSSMHTYHGRKQMTNLGNKIKNKVNASGIDVAVFPAKSGYVKEGAALVADVLNTYPVEETHDDVALMQKAENPVQFFADWQEVHKKNCAIVLGNKIDAREMVLKACTALGKKPADFEIKKAEALVINLETSEFEILS